MLTLSVALTGPANGPVMLPPLLELLANVPTVGLSTVAPRLVMKEEISGLEPLSLGMETEISAEPVH